MIGGVIEHDQTYIYIHTLISGFCNQTNYLN